MRMYGKRILGNAIDRQVAKKAETKDAICWDILEEQRIARVKIQGSAEYVVAHYPQNWSSAPAWLRPGNAVRITHPGGMRGRIELTDHGVYIPTPISGDQFPTATTPPDAVLSGMAVAALNPEQMKVGVLAGTYRIDGATYYFAGVGEELAMQDPPIMEMGDNIPMGTILGAVVDIDPAPATPGQFRYDLIVVGTDGIPECVKGSEAAEPEMPEVPSDHVLCGYILLFYGMTEISQVWINRPWEEPGAASIEAIPDDDELSWAETETDITITIKDQYGIALAPSGTWGITADWDSGNGTFGGVAAPGQFAIASPSASFAETYERDQEATDKSPVLRITLYGDSVNLITSVTIRLLSATGEPMY